jgi:hypothetical protein
MAMGHYGHEAFYTNEDSQMLGTDGPFEIDWLEDLPHGANDGYLLQDPGSLSLVYPSVQPHLTCDSIFQNIPDYLDLSVSCSSVPTQLNLPSLVLIQRPTLTQRYRWKPELIRPVEES